MKNDRLLQEMMAAPMSTARDIWIARAKAETDARDDARDWLRKIGYTEVDGSDIAVTAPDAEYTGDGRVVLRAHGKIWAMDQAAFDAMQMAARRNDPPRVATGQPEVTESIAATTCPQMIDGKPCGGALNRKGVCPSCVTGRMGYRYRYTCESCGCDIVTREELR